MAHLEEINRLLSCLALILVAAEQTDAVIEGDIGIGVLFVEQALDTLHNHVAHAVIERRQQQREHVGRKLGDGVDK